MNIKKIVFIALLPALLLPTQANAIIVDIIRDIMNSIDRNNKMAKRTDQDVLNEELVQAVQQKDVSQVKKLLKKGAKPVVIGYGTSLEGKTALHEAVRNKDTAMISLLLQHGADINMCENASYSGRGTPLHLAVTMNEPSLVAFLVQKGADINAYTIGADARTPFHTALFADNIPMMKLLLELGAEINSIRNNPLMIASRQKSYEIVQFLLENGARLNLEELPFKEETPLYWAIVNRNVPLFKLLVQHGADVNMKDRDGNTPLFWTIENFKDAAYLDSEKSLMAEILLEHGADIQATNRNGSLLRFAESYRNRAMAEFFKSRGVC